MADTTETVPQAPGGRTSPAPQATVDDVLAEELQERFAGLSTIELRECLEYEPVSMAARLLRWASSRRDPYRALRNYARKNRTGHYRPRRRKPSHKEEYARHLAFIARREREKRKRRGRGLFQGERENLAREFYAPSHRAEMHRAREREDAA